MGFVGVVRAEFLRARNFDYVRAARALGVSNIVIMFLLALPLSVAVEGISMEIPDGAFVVLLGPTGAGKTVVAEHAVSLALAAGTKAFYTAPIKALSNQKYHDLCGRHGADRVGLLTGDTSVNGDAPVVVMTTEVLRNMIYGRRDLGDLGVVGVGDAWIEMSTTDAREVERLGGRAGPRSVRIVSLSIPPNFSVHVRCIKAVCNCIGFRSNPPRTYSPTLPRAAGG